MSILAEVLTEEQRVERAVVQIMRNPKYIFLTNILLMGRLEVIDADITACTDGKDVLFGREFVASLSDAELRFLILHESYHKMYRHLRIYAHLNAKDGKCANQACDYVINLQIVDENKDGFAVMPKDGCLDERFRDMNASQVFDLIYEDKKDSDGGGGGEPLPEPDDDCGDGGGGEPLDDHDWDGANDMSDDEAEAQDAEIDRALRQGAILAGKQGAGLSDSIKELLKPRVDWRKALRDFVSDRCVGKDYGTYARPNRRFVGSDIYLPSLVSETVPELLIAMDTSGSCWHALPYFLAEVESICKNIKALKVHIMFWDTEVVYEMHEGNAVEDIKMQHAYGGGGTDVNCVTTYLKEHNIKPTASVLLTDGYLSDGWGEWDHPVFWGLITTEIPPTGKYIHIEDWEN